MFLSQAAIDAVFGVDVDHDSFSRRPARAGAGAPLNLDATRAAARQAVPEGEDPRGVARPGRSLVSGTGSADAGPAR